jgi:Protein of unknown function (DUF4089)
MKSDEFDAEKLAEAMADFLGLPLEEAYRAGVTMHLNAAHDIAAPLLAFPLDDDAEPAPVFTP